MESESDYGSSASRVKAFRTRLNGQFKRVEAYITEGEKSAIEQVKSELGVTTDVAVAGLLRMGLERFQEQRSASNAAPRAVGATEVRASESLTFSASASLDVCGALSAPAAMSTRALSAPVALMASRSPKSVSSSPPVLASLAQSSDDNPIARFFKNRKEISQ